MEEKWCGEKEDNPRGQENQFIFSARSQECAAGCRLYSRTGQAEKYTRQHPKMPPKVSQLLTRVLAREHDDDGSSSSSSEDDYGLQQMAKNASPGMRMGERVREGEGERATVRARG